MTKFSRFQRLRQRVFEILQEKQFIPKQEIDPPIVSIQMIHLLYTIIGGIYASKGLSQRFKIIWFCFFFIHTLLTVVSVAGYFLTMTGTINFYTFFSISISFMSALNFTILTPSITYLYHRELEATLYYTTEKYCSRATRLVDDTQKECGIRFEKVNTIKEASLWIILCICSSSSMIVIYVIDVLYLCHNEYAFRDLLHHSMGYPYMERIPSIQVALLLYAIEYWFILISIFISLTQVAFLMLVAMQMNNIIVDYRQEIYELAVSINAGLWDEQKFTFLIQEYQKFVRIVENCFRPYLELSNTIILAVIIAVLISTIYTILLARFEAILKLVHALLIIGICVYFYPQCYCGSIFNDMNESVFQQVYDLPWYHLPPKQRKFLYTFLCEVQRPIKFKAFKVYTVDLQMFPQILKATYSFANLLRHSIEIH